MTDGGREAAIGGRFPPAVCPVSGRYTPTRVTARQDRAVPDTFSLWSIQRDGRFVTFQLGDDGVHVGSVWVGPQALPPYEYCG